MYIIDYLRTPQVFSNGHYQTLSAVELASKVVQSLLARHPKLDPFVDEIICGNVAAVYEHSNVARAIALNCGLPKVNGVTINKNCSSGLEAIKYAGQLIQSGNADLILVGGVESFSRIPLASTIPFAAFVQQLQRSGFSAKYAAIKKLLKFGLGDLVFHSPLKKGMFDVLAQIDLVEMADLLASQFSISREQQDQYAIRSHRLALTAQTLPDFQSALIPMTANGQLVSRDQGPMERHEDRYRLRRPLKKRAYMDNAVTAFNASALTDGASFMLMASEKCIHDFGLVPRAKVVGEDTVSLLPEEMGIAPFYSMDRLLQRLNKSCEDVSFFEINEAFASQVLSVKKLMEEHWSISEGFWEQKVNTWGGAIAMGHPFGATGIRLIGNLILQLEAHQRPLGLASICVAGGMGQSMMIERCSQK